MAEWTEACIQAREDEIVVKLIDLKKSEGGIILPGAKVHDVRLAEVVTIGEGFYAGDKRIKPSLEPGDIVLLRPNRGTAFEIRGRSYLFVSTHDIPVKLLDPDEVAPKSKPLSRPHPPGNDLD